MESNARKKVLVAITAALLAATSLAAGDSDPGAAIFAKNCVACHLASGHGNVAIKAPSIAGLDSWYVAHQLQRFRDGIRGTHVKDDTGKLMRHVVESLDEEQIALLARHVSQLPPNTKRRTMKGGDPARGKQLFRENCMACHRYNASGERVFRSAPLTSQQDWYLLAQLKKFEAHHRGNAKGDKLGPKMQLATARLDVKADGPDIVAYVASLPPPKRAAPDQTKAKKEAEPESAVIGAGVAPGAD